MKPSKIVLFTVTFPFEGENFLSYELPFLCHKFEHVTIVVLKKKQKKINFDIPDNCSVTFLPRTIGIKNFRHLFSSFLFIELYYFLRAKGSKTLKKFIYRLFVGLRVKTIIEKKYSGNDYILYSYWMNGAALGIALSNTSEEKIKICRAHGSDVYNENIKSGLNPFQNYIICNLTRCYTISVHGKEYLEKLYSPKLNEISVSYLGVPTVKNIDFHNEKKNVDVKVVISCSVVDSNKRVSDIFHSLNELDQKIIWIHFGSGPLLSDLKKEVFFKRRKGLKVLLTGYKSTSQIHDFYKMYNSRVNLFVNYSLFEGIPVSIMEAMSYGIPCLATDVGGTQEIITRHNGMLIDANPDKVKLSEAVKIALKSFDNKQNSRNFAMCTVREKFNAQDNFSNFVESLYNI
jgi:glycosyltransferase involved in cell wall biosynthesis